jgi:acetyl esterase/lipase
MRETKTTSRQARIVRAVTSAYFSLKDAETADVQRSRSMLDRFAGLVPVADRVTVERVEIAGRPAEWLSPVTPVKGKALLYLHGGAYILGSCASHRHMVSYIARHVGIRALLPEYRLAPEHPFPAAVEDAAAVYRAMLEQGYEPRNIVVAGDSAGGGLTMAMLLALRDTGDPMPAAAFLLSPWLDLATTGDTMETRSEQDPWFHKDDIALVARYYCGGEELKNPLVSPVFAELHGMPSVHIQVGNDEVLLSDATRLADRIRESGGEVHVDVWDGMWHVFQAFLLLVPESREAMKILSRRMQDELSKP